MLVSQVSRPARPLDGRQLPELRQPSSVADLVLRPRMRTRGVPSNKDETVGPSVAAEGVLPASVSLCSIAVRLTSPALERQDLVSVADAVFVDMQVDPLPAAFVSQAAIPVIGLLS